MTMGIDGWWWLCMIGWMAIGVVVRVTLYLLGEDV